MFSGNITGDSMLPFVFIMLLIIFIFVWLVWGEMRTKILKVGIEKDRIGVTNFQGLGNLKIVLFSEIDGFKTCVLPSEYKDYEYLYLIKNGQKIIKLSEFYHKNYAELKNEISKKCKNLGIEKFSLGRVIKELFS